MWNYYRYKIAFKSLAAMKKQPVVFLIHLAILIIMSGGFLTCTTSVQGKLHLRTDESTNRFIDRKNNTVHTLPFNITLSGFQIIYYPGTEAPSDYVSTLKIRYENKEVNGQVSLNKVFSQNGFRFYQSGYDKDEQGSFLLVKSDRYGLAVTYFGYFLLLTSMTAYFFNKNTTLRKLLGKWGKSGKQGIYDKPVSPISPASPFSPIIIIFLLLTTVSAIAENRNTIPVNIAKKMGDLQILYRNRICPLETFAKDLTLKLHGKSSYKSLCCEQVLFGYLFYMDD